MNVLKRAGQFQPGRPRVAPAAELLAQLDLTPEDVIDKKFYHGRGCVACNNTGFKGRTGLYEYLPINDQLRDLINEGASTQQLRDKALQVGMVPLRESGLEKVFGGITTVEEVVRETVAEG